MFVLRLPAGEGGVDIVSRKVAEVRGEGVRERTGNADIAVRPLLAIFERETIGEAEQKAVDGHVVAGPILASLIDGSHSAGGTPNCVGSASQRTSRVSAGDGRFVLRLDLVGEFEFIRKREHASTRDRFGGEGNQARLCRPGR